MTLAGALQRLRRIMIGLLFGALLIVGGVLALIGNKAYKEYRYTKGL